MDGTRKFGIGARLGVLAVLAAGLGLFSAAAVVGAPAQGGLARADRLYAEKSYGAAAKAYEQLAIAGKVPPARRDEVQYRIAVALGKGKQWDRSLERSLAFVKAHRGTVWEPRGLYWLARLYLGVPHQAWRVETTKPAPTPQNASAPTPEHPNTEVPSYRLFRGDQVPQKFQGEKPEQLELSAQDLRNALDALEAARVLYPRHRKTSATEAEEIQLNHDLAHVLADSAEPQRWASAKKWKLPADPSWTIDPAATYSPAWPYPKRVLFLYEQNRILSKQQVPGLGAQSAALALLAKAMWLREYHSLMSQFALALKNYQLVKTPYPYQSLRSDDVLRELVRSFPDAPVREQAQFTLASWLEADGRYLDAEREYRRLLSMHTKGRWAANARAQLQELKRRQLNVGASPPAAPGKPLEVQVSFRNVKRFRLDVFEFDLRRYALSAAPAANFQAFSELLGEFPKATRRFGKRVLSQEVTTHDTGDHAQREQTYHLSVTRPGSYVIQASAPGVRSARLHLATDLALVQKVDRDSVLLFAANARSGTPVPGAEVWAKIGWTEESKERSIVVHQRTSRAGLASIALPLKANRDSYHVDTTAYQNGNYALANRGEQVYAELLQTLKVYSMTDRAVYRPEQVVHYRQLVMRQKAGVWKPAAGERVRVQISDPRGAQLLNQVLTTSEFGSINGELTLPEGSALGEYSIEVRVPRRGEIPMGSGSNRFRVEEYKKPEFEITVEPTAERVRLDEKTAAHVQARYYFGGPVPNAKVTYRVYRNPFVPQHRFPRPYDFLYRYWNEGNYQTDYHQGEVVTQGEARTDAEGNAKIEIDTAASQLWGESDLTYTVEADVQDASRRVISGSGAVKATRHDVLVFLDYPQGYARKNERVRVEVATTDPSDKPVAVSGTASIFRQNPQTGKEALLSRKPLAMDDQGRAFIEWTPPAGGYFRFEYATRDRAEQPVTGTTNLWVEGPELAKTNTSTAGLVIQAEKQAYEEGQQAKVLVIAPSTGCTVLLTREANNEILGRQLLYVSGRSLEVTLPLTRTDVPNVYLSAVLIRNHQAFRAQQELFVPPARQFAAVTVEADRERYQPGEKAKLRLLARDWRGKPLRTELSVAVTDAALNYIQKDYAPDIRLFFFGDRRSLSTQAEVSPEITFGSLDQDTQHQSNYATHVWVLPEGMGMLPEWPGTTTPISGELRSLRYYSLDGSVNILTRDRGGSVTVGTGYSADQALIGRATLSDTNYRLRRGDRSYLPASAPAALLDLGGVLHGKKMLPASTILGGQLADSAVRTVFADTAFWTPAVVTDAQGQASVEVTWPDNLTQWRATAAGASTSAQVGSGETQVVTKKDLIVRLQAPRFFVERDEVVLSANVHNYLPEATRAQVKLELDGDTADLAPAAEAIQWVDLPKDGEQRVNWTVHVRHEGDLRVRMTARTPQAADATELTLPVLVHGVERQVAQSGVLRTERQATVPIRLPEARKPGSSELVVQLSPSLATVALDALPYLADYPYGCIEQTMSRFLPSVVVAKTLKDLGYNLSDLRTRARQLEQVHKETTRREAGSGYTYPKGRPGAAQTPQAARWANPVFSDAKLGKMVRSGLARITEFQHDDGGWGWWKEDASDPHMTAYVLYGLTLARDAGTSVDAGILERGLQYLQGQFQREEDPHQLAYEARVLAMHPPLREAIRQRTLRKIYDRRDRLTAYSQGLLALALHDLGERGKAQVLLRNLESTVKTDRDNGTASWEAESPRWWWRWWNNRVETNATLLQAYLAIRPDSELPAMLTKWLVNNRRGAIWQSTRDTALAVLSLSDYLRRTKELSPDYTLTVALGDQTPRSFRVTKENALLFDGGLTVPDVQLRTGEQPLRITKTGSGPLYYSAYTRYFSLEEPIRATGNEVFVQRRYFRLRPGTAAGTADRQAQLNPTSTADRENPFLTGHYALLDLDDVWVRPGETADGPRYERTPLREDEVLTSGALLEVELQLESKNDYDYLIFEDMKPSGCEPVEVRSGDKAGLGLYSNMELRDDKVAFFLSSLPQGHRTLTYRLRAEIPGRFHVLPTNGYAMYAPDIRTLSDESTFTIRDPD